MAEPVDGALWERWNGEGDSGAFMELVLRHSSMVYATCMRILGNGSDAEEVTQECFLELVRSGGRVRTTYGGWLHGVAVKRALMRVRSDKRRREREKAYAGDLPTTSSPTWEDVAPHLDGCIKELPEALREAIVLHFLEGKTYAETGERLGVSPSTVQRRERKALDALRKLLAKRGVLASSLALGSLVAVHSAEASAIPPALTTTLGKIVLAQGVTHTAAVGAASTVGGLLIMKKVVVTGIAVVLIVGALVVRQYLEEPATRVDPDMKPPPLPAEIQAKVDALTKPIEDESPPSNIPVLLAEALPVEEPKPEDDSLRPATVSGLVRDQEKNPVPGAILELAIGQDVSSGGSVEARYSAQTGQDGRYWIDGINVFGNACLSASAEGYTRQRTFSPDESTIDSLLLRRLESGVDYTYDFELLPVGHVVAGRVVNSSRVPIAGARVWVVGNHGLPRDIRWRQGAIVSMTDSKGGFSIDLPGKGSCVLDVRKEGYGLGLFPDIRANSKRLELVLYKGGAIAGRVTTKSGNPAIGAPIAVRAEQGGGDIWSGTPPGHTTRTDENGEYRVEDLSDTLTYRVRLSYKLPERPTNRETARNQSDFVLRQEFCLVRSSYNNLHYRELVGEETGVVVRPETVTRVDFVVDDQTQSSTAFYGRVTDPDTGEPASPIYVSAQTELPLKGGGGNYIGEIGSSITGPDGAYRIEIAGLAQPTEITIGASYFTRWPTPERSRDVTTLLVKPNDSHEVNFTMPMGVTVPIRTVSRTGEPLEGISVRHVVSDPEGRLTLYGLEPNVTTQLKASTKIDGGTVRVGVTEPFVGKPGETLPEQEIICDLSTGKLTGYFAIPEGVDVDGMADGFARFDIGLIAQFYYHNGRTHSQMADMGWNASFAVKSAPPGLCSIHLYVLADNPEYQWWTFIEDVEILPDHVTDLGEIVLNPPELNSEQ